MKSIATPLTALAAGAWTGMGGSAFALWERLYPSAQDWSPLVLMFGSIPFILLPGLLFVGRWQRGKETTKSFFAKAGRMACWLISALLVTAAGTTLVLRYAS
jgi:hypothetical protein